MRPPTRLLAGDLTSFATVLINAFAPLGRILYLFSRYISPVANRKPLLAPHLELNLPAQPRGADRALEAHE